MPVKPEERPVEFSGGAATFVNLVITGLVLFGFVHWSDQQIAWAYAVGNFLAQVAIWFYLRRTVTPLANPKTAEGVKLEPVKPVTRGIPKGE